LSFSGVGGDDRGVARPRSCASASKIERPLSTTNSTLPSRKSQAPSVIVEASKKQKLPNTKIRFATM
jgi:hypothetical protein